MPILYMKNKRQQGRQGDQKKGAGVEDGSEPHIAAVLMVQVLHFVLAKAPLIS